MMCVSSATCNLQGVKKQKARAKKSASSASVAAKKVRSPHIADAPPPRAERQPRVRVRTVFVRRSTLGDLTRPLAQAAGIAKAAAKAEAAGKAKAAKDLAAAQAKAAAKAEAAAAWQQQLRSAITSASPPLALLHSPGCAAAPSTSWRT